ncbi:MAG TPA: right-handed parallel beta-helix repeat-containing protein [Casimicrobiaceae bacterium]|nr:right-handed parallel beta-helix repeat-containing protein [Casimicrobiaceae bacterium]
MLAHPRKALPACLAAFLAANSTAAFAGNDAIASPNMPPAPDSVRTVDNCDDAGPGSLRDAVGGAISGDVIDLTQLACSEITLFGGKIAVTVGDLTLLGPGVGPDATQHLKIHGFYDRILEHGIGTLIVSGLDLEDGHYYGVFARGGCISSSGTLIVEDSIVSGCEVDAPFGSNSFAAGGGIYTTGELWLKNSMITNNVAYSATQVAYGGGVFASYVVTIEASAIAGNKVVSPQAYAIGGGLMVGGFSDVTIVRSTISGNEAELAGGIRVDTLGTTQIVDSTLSGNHASLYVGAGSFTNSAVKLINSTVTRNSAYAYTGGVYSNQAITVQSSILADNRAAATDAFDLCAPTIGGSANLITSACHATPPDTVTRCPRLTPLADHGGPTLTHALIAGSEGIDIGNNTLQLVADQRGVGWPRVIGPNADIGAFEWQGDLGDDILKSAFESACDEY